MSMNKSKLNKTADLLNETLNEHCYHDAFSHLFWAALDVIESKINKQPLAKHKHKHHLTHAKSFLITKQLSLLIYQSYIS